MKIKKNILKYKNPETGEYAPIPVVATDGVSKENIEAALGYTPADEEKVTELNEKIVQETDKLSDEIGDVKETLVYIQEELPKGNICDVNIVGGEKKYTNIYEQSHNYNGYWINESGELLPYENASYAKIPLKAGVQYYYMNRKMSAYLSSRNMGAFIISNENENIVLLPENCERFTVEDGTNIALKIPKQTIQSYLYVTVKLGTNENQNWKDSTCLYEEQISGGFIDGVFGRKFVPFNNLVGKHIVYDGDSICESRTGSYAYNGGGYAKIIADKTGSTFENFAVSGAHLTSVKNSPYYSNTTTHSVVDNLSALPTNADLYCFEGGLNDWSRGIPMGTYSEKDYFSDVDINTMCGALEYIFRYSLSIFLGKQICFIIVHKCGDSFFVNNKDGKTFKDWHDAMVGICNKYSIPYYDACLYSGLNGFNANQSNTFLTGGNSGVGDMTHPNELGYKTYYVPQLLDLFKRIIPE